MPPESCTRIGSIAVDGKLIPTLTVPPACGVGPVVVSAPLVAAVVSAAADVVGSAALVAPALVAGSAALVVGDAAAVVVSPPSSESPHAAARNPSSGTDMPRTLPRRIRSRRVMRFAMYASMRLFSTSVRSRRTSSTRRWTSFMPSPSLTRDASPAITARRLHQLRSGDRALRSSRPTAGLILAPVVAIFKLRSGLASGAAARRCAGSPPGGTFRSRTIVAVEGSDSASVRRLLDVLDALAEPPVVDSHGVPRAQLGVRVGRERTAIAPTARGPRRGGPRRPRREVDRVRAGWGLYLLAARVVGAPGARRAPRYVDESRGANGRERLRPAPARPATA